MTKQLEVIQQKDAIKDSVTEAQKNDVDNFVKAFEADKKKGESKPEQIINIFNDKGTTILDNIIKNIENIDAVNIAKFNAAALAFETDLTEYSKKNG